MRNWTLRGSALAAALLLAGCGGGGGGGGGGGVAAPPGDGLVVQPVGPDTGVPPVSGQVRISGTMLFESVPVLAAGGLAYDQRRAKPARGVAVELVDGNGHSLGKTRTDAAGRYSFGVPVNASVRLLTYASMVVSGDEADPGVVQVVDNTADSALWTTRTRPIAVGNRDLSVEVTMPHTGRAAAPFAILDTVYDAQAQVSAAVPGLAYPPLVIWWSPENRPSTTIDVATGQLPGAAFIQLNGLNLVMLNGKEGVDTDEFDRSVVSHEWGHYVMRVFGRTDSRGGVHRSGEKLDHPTAFSEGFGNALSGMLLGLNHYVDSFGPGQSDTLVLDLETGPASDRGWFNEASIAQVLWQLHQSVGLGPIFEAIRGPFRSTIASTGVHSFNAALGQVAPAAAARFAPLLLAQDIQPQADAWGVGETNSGGSETSLPLVQPLVPGQPLPTACVSSALDPHREGNKLGGTAHLRFSVPAQASYRIRIQGPAGATPEFRVNGPLGVDHRGAGDSTLALAAGDYLMAVRDQTPSNAKTCFTVNLQ